MPQRTQLWFVALIVTIGLVAHCLYTLQPYFMDEGVVVRNQLRFVSQRTLMPDHAKYPTFFYYLSLPFTALSIFIASHFGPFGSVNQTAAEMILFFKRDLVLGARIFNVLLLYASALVLFALVRRQVSLRSAILTFALVTCTPGLLEYPAYALPDTLLIFLGACGMWLMYRVKSPRDSLRLYAVAACFGLALATKYNAVGLALAAAVWFIFFHYRAGSALTYRFFAQLAVSAITLIAFFLLASPGWIVDPGFFLSELSFEVEHAKYGHLGTTGVPLLGQLELLFRNFPVLFPLSAIGAYFALKTAPRDVLVPCSIFLMGLLVAAMSKKQSFQYLFPAIPGMIVLASYSVQVIISRYGEKGTSALVAVALAVSLISAHRAAAYIRPNSTTLTKGWIVEHIPAGESIALDWSYVPDLYSKEALEEIRQSRTYRTIEHDPLINEKTFEIQSINFDFAALDASNAEYFVTSEEAFDRYFEFGVFTRKAPSDRDPVYSDFVSNRNFYEQLFSSSIWTIAFEADTGNGPHTLVFQRTRAEDSNP